jgi:hypothetical protein
MKSNFTFFSRQVEFVKTISAALLVFSSVALYSCTTSAQENLSKESETDTLQEGNNVFTFHQNKNGKDINWKAVFKDGELTELYKNGKRVPDENVEDYKDMVNEELEDLHDNNDQFGRNSSHFNVDMGGPDDAMAHLGDNFKDMNFDNDDCDSVWDNEQFHKDMDSLKINMKKLHKMKFNFHFDTTAFSRGMKELRQSLKKLKYNPHMNLYKNGFPGCDMEAFKDGMKNFNEEMKHNRIFNEDFKIDMSEFADKMKDFNKNMKNFELNMRDFNKNMKKFIGFFKDLKHELVKDNLIKDEGEKFNMKFNSKEMIINGNKVPGDLFEKYKGIYKKNYGKEIDNDFIINNKCDDEGDIYNK